MTTQDNPTLPQPPFYSIPNINNLRDAALYSGGLTTPTGKIRPGILFRSAEVSKLDVSGWKAVKDIGVAHVFDLRAKQEVEKGWKGVTGEKDTIGEDGKDVRPGWLDDLEAAGVKRTWTPVFEEDDYSPDRLAERYLKYMSELTQGFVQAYQDILSHAGPAFKIIFQYLASIPAPGASESGSFLSNNPKAPATSKEPLGALVHCTAGKDRTGIFFGLLFLYLGVPREQIAEEYNLTELGLAHVRSDIGSRLMLSPGFKLYTQAKMEGREPTPDELSNILKKKENETGEEEPEAVVPPEILEQTKQAALRMVSARKEAMLGALDMIEKEWGSAEKYLKEVVGLGDGELEALRRNLVVPA
jgi:protein tyrosine/serine phosphatase